VLDSSKNWWKLRNTRGQVGHAPYTILQEVSSDAFSDLGSGRNRGAAGSPPMIPSPPPLPPPIPDSNMLGATRQTPLRGD